MKETGFTISTWALETFGPAGSDASVAARANEEMAELLRAVTAEGGPVGIATECADVVIVLARLAARQGFDLFDMVDRKMAVNRKREWRLDATGHGYHIPEPPK